MSLVFSSIESKICNKGKFKGHLTTFVNLVGCNLNCKDCKKSYSIVKRLKKQADDIVPSILRLGNDRIVITGESLLQDDIYILTYNLVSRGLKVVIETNGSIDIEETLYNRSYNFSINFRTPSSNSEKTNILPLIDKLITGDEIRFKVNNYEDYKYASLVYKKYKGKAQYVLTTEDITLSSLIAEWLKEDKLNNFRLDLVIKGEDLNV